MEPRSEQLLLQEMQVLLAEKRTYYSLLRTGLTVMSVPLSIIIFLLATTKYHKIFDHWWLALVVVGALICASMGGLVIFQRSQHKLRKINKMIHQRERENSRIAEIMV